MALHKEKERICASWGTRPGCRPASATGRIYFTPEEIWTGAMALHKEEERICRELGNKHGLSYSLGNQANILYDRGDWTRRWRCSGSRSASAASWEQDRAAGLPRNQANTLCAREDLDGAMALHREQERICRELGTRTGSQPPLGNQANILYVRGDLDGAMALHREHERLCREMGKVEGLAISLANQAALTAFGNRRPREALPLAEEAHRIATRHALTAAGQADRRDIEEK